MFTFEKTDISLVQIRPHQICDYLATIFTRFENSIIYLTTQIETIIVPP
jgi:hypothetical protein